MRRIVGLLATALSAGCTYVAVADNVQFGFWGWDRLPEQLTVNGREYRREQACLGPPRGVDARERGTLWTVLGPRREIEEHFPPNADPFEHPGAVFIGRARGCTALYRLER